jgi:hypothetical protein
VAVVMKQRWVVAVDGGGGNGMFVNIFVPQ